MGRLVQPAQMETVAVRRRGGGLESTGSVQVPVGGDGFADRVAKYIPGEVLAGYMAIDRALVPSADAFHATRRALIEKASTGAGAVAEKLAGPPAMAPDFKLMLHQNVPLLILAACLILTPLYIRQMALSEGGRRTPWRMHAVVATLAFLVWAYAIQGSAFTLWPGGSLYDGGFAAALVALFTMVSGLFKPAPTGEAGAPQGTRDAGGRAL